MLPNRDDVLLIMRGCCQSIGLDWPTPAEMEKFSVKALVKQIRDASPTTWNASLEMFTGLIQLRFLRNQCFARRFDDKWFTNNQSKTMYDLSVYLTNNAVDLGPGT